MLYELSQAPSPCAVGTRPGVPPSILLIGSFGQNPQVSKAVQFFREAARKVDLRGMRVETLSFNRGLEPATLAEKIKNKVQDINATVVFAFGNEATKAIFGVSHPALDVRKGYGFLDDQTVVHLLPDALHVHRNRFRSKWIVEDIKWALEASSELQPLRGVAVRVNPAEVSRLLAGHDVVWDVETFGHYADNNFRILTMCAAIAGDNRVVVWREADLAKGTAGYEAAKQVFQTCKMSGHNRMYDLIACSTWFGCSRPTDDDGDCSYIMARLLRADGAGGLEPLASTVGMVGHKRQAVSQLHAVELTIDHVREQLVKPIPIRWEEEYRTNKAGKRQKRKVAVEWRSPSSEEARQIISDDLDKRRAKYPELGSFSVDWMTAALKGDDAAWYSQAMIDPDVRDRYCALDVLTTSMLMPKLRAELEQEPDIHTIYKEVVQKAPRTFQHLSQAGVGVDIEELHNFAKFIDERSEELRQSIVKLAEDPDFNPKSDAQVRELLFTKLGLKSLGETEGGQPSVSAAILTKLKADHEIVSPIIEYRELAKLQSNYARGLLPHVRDDGAIHCGFNLMGTESGRISASAPNMTTIPSRGQYAKRAKALYKARPNKKLVVLDYKTIEPMVAAVLSNDPEMIKTFESGEDFHCRTGKIVSMAAWGSELPSWERNPNKPGYVAELQPEIERRRKIAKVIGLAATYGQSAASLAEAAGCSESVAQAAHDALFQTYSGLKRWIKEQIQAAHHTGETWTFWNNKRARRRPIPDVGDQDPSARSHGERVSYNSPVQGTGHEYLLASAIKLVHILENSGYNARVVLVVHDALYIEVDEEDVDEVTELAIRVMTSWWFGPLKLQVEPETGTTLADLKPWTRPSTTP